MSKKTTKVTSKKSNIKLGEVPDYNVTYSRDEQIWGVHMNEQSIYILPRLVGKKKMYYVGTRFFKTLRDAIFSVVLGNMSPF